MIVVLVGLRISGNVQCRIELWKQQSNLLKRSTRYKLVTVFVRLISCCDKKLEGFLRYLDFDLKIFSDLYIKQIHDIQNKIYYFSLLAYRILYQTNLTCICRLSEDQFASEKIIRKSLFRRWHRIPYRSSS